MCKFRCARDIIFDDEDITPGQICNVRLKPRSATCNLFQFQSPLTPEHPYFFAKIRSLAPYSKITLGIAGADIASDVHPGHWLNSVGYHSDTGQCFSSHQCVTNTEGEKFGIGDMFGVLVTYFGEKKSTVIFLKNGSPVATMFLFEPDHSHFFPTISLENGPIDLGLMWPQTTIDNPVFSEKNMLHWICPVSVRYDTPSNSFMYVGESKIRRELAIKSPLPLGPDCQHFEVILEKLEDGCPGPSIALAGCSPVVFPLASPLVKDFIRFDLDRSETVSLVGHRIGWGIHYNPDLCNKSDFNPKSEQLVYCYVTADMEMISGSLMMQPEGGFYPVVILSQGVSKVAIDIESKARPAGLTKLLDSCFKMEMFKIKKEMLPHIKNISMKESMLRRSKEIEMTIINECCKLKLPSDKPGVHVVQFTRPLKEDSNFFLICIRSLHEDSAIAVGVAGKDFPLNKFPGKMATSVGFMSKDGRLYRNLRHDGNLIGERYQEGDMVGVEMEAFAKNMSVVLFTKNLHPVGTVYYTQPNRAEFLPTIALCANGHDVIVDVYWQNQMQGAPILSVVNLEHWCLPPGSKVDHSTNTVYVKDHLTPVCIQAPYSLHKGYNHFEVRLTKPFSSICPPPAIVLSTPTPLEPPPKSCLKLDFLRFWAVDEASKLLQVGDLVGWGLLYTDDTLHRDEEQLIICYLTVNRRIILVRVVYQPPGGFYPLIVLPPGLNEVTLEFSASIITKHPITSGGVNILLAEAKELMKKERAILEKGGDPISELKDAALFRSPPAEETTGKMDQMDTTVPDRTVEKDAKTNKMVTVITDSPFNRKKLKRTLSEGNFHDVNKNSKSCVVL